MTLREYLLRLEDALRAMDPVEREDFLREMESHVADLRERRPDEEEAAIVAGLTPPERLAEELLGSAGRDGAAGDGAAGGGGIGAETPAGGGSARASDGPEGARRSRGASSRLKAALAALEALTGAARLGGDDADEEGNGEFVRAYPGAGISTIRVSLLAADLHVRPSADGSIRLRAEGAVEGLNFFVEESADLLACEERGCREGSIDSLELEVPDGVELVELAGLSGDIEVEGLACGLRLETKSGDIAARDCAGPVVAESASGDIGLDSVGPASAVSASGSIEASGIGGDFAAKSATGDIGAEDVEGRIAAETVQGDIELSGVAGRLLAKSMSGAVSIAECAGPMSVSTHSGDVVLDFGDGFAGATVSTISGDLTASFSGEPDAVLRVATRSGGIEIDGEERRGGETTLGRGGEELSLSSVSGDISVEW